MVNTKSVRPELKRRTAHLPLSDWVSSDPGGSSAELHITPEKPGSSRPRTDNATYNQSQIVRSQTS